MQKVIALILLLACALPQAGCGIAKPAFDAWKDGDVR